MKRRWILVAAGVGAVGIVAAVGMCHRPPVVPAVASVAQLRAGLDAHREGLLRRRWLPLAAEDAPGPVVELPAGRKVRFVAAATGDWNARGGRFAPDGTFTPPNAGEAFLFPASFYGLRAPARFVLRAPPASGVAPVPNAADLPPVVASVGEERTVWTGRLARSGDRYLLPITGLAMIADGFPAPRVGIVAPARLPLGALGGGANPDMGILLGRTMLFRVRGEETVVKGGPGKINETLLRIGLGPLPFLPQEIVSGRPSHYEARTLVHLYRREGARWRYAGTRVAAMSREGWEGSDAAALRGLGFAPWPGAHEILGEAPFVSAEEPGRKILPYGAPTR